MNDFLNEFGLVVQEFMLAPGVPSRLGIMIATAVAIGLWLKLDTKNYKKWLITTGVYLFFQEWMRISILRSYNDTITIRPSMLVILSISIFASALWLGGWIGVKSRESAEKSVLENLNGNGHPEFGTS